ncbi:MAG: hypothetical protein KDD89_03485 [Anaerolineales bacterium]|nr:hypothetical protein [Anaerolineales bacterium]
MISAYFATLQATLDRYSLLYFVQDVRITFDKRPSEQGYVVGQVVFQDESELHFREYLDAMGRTLSKLRYSYHYQSPQKELLFRYDNARHKPPLNQLEHKHVGNEIKLVSEPTLDDVLLEIVTVNGWV